MIRWHVKLLHREARAGSAQLLLFSLCVLLAALSVSVVAGWRHSVDSAMASENKKSAGGDLVVFSTEPFTPALISAAATYHGIRTSEMFTVALAPRTDLSLFSKLKAVDPGYPLYGELPLRSGGDPQAALQRGVIVEERVLERLEAKVGDSLKVGARVFEIADVAIKEPDRPLGMFGVSPRIFIAFDQLESTGLLRPGSYLERRIHIRLPNPSQAERVAQELRQVAVPDQERIETWESPPVSMERFVNNFFIFLDMMAVLATVLGGLGMQSTLSTWLANRRPTIAVMKAFGANGRFVTRHYAAIVGVVALMGLLLGLLAASVILHTSGAYLSSMLPVVVEPRLSWISVLEASTLCLAVAAAFSVWPLLEAGSVKPAIILRQEPSVVKRSTRLKQMGLAVLTLYALLSALSEDLIRAAWISLGLTLILGITAFFAHQSVRRIRQWRPANLAWRTALGTWRAPTSKTVSVVFVLSTCLTILFAASIVERALRENWVSAMPTDVPNLVFLDIQPEQAEAFTRFVDSPMELTSTMRVRAQAVEGKPIDRSKKREYWDRDARRELDASPLTELPENDELVQGGALFQGDDPHQVSIRDDVAKALNVKIGSEVSFTIQGVPVSAKVSSVRISRREGFRPRFELIFPPALVEGAPRTMYARMRLDEDKVGALQTRVAKEFPSIVSMDISLTIRLVAERLFQMVGVVRYFLLAGLLAGAVILVSAAWSARWDRLREAAYFKILGANRSFLQRVLLYENLALGALCSSLSFVLAVVISYGLCQGKLDIPYPDISDLVLPMVLLPTVVISGLGWILSRGILAAKPAPILRAGADS